MINTAVENILKHIPIVWPLQQLIAVNPLWDLIDQSVENVAPTLTHDEYMERYKKGEIKDQHLKQFSDNLDELFKKKAHKAKNSILISQQLKSLFFDEPARKIKEECLNLIINYIDSDANSFLEYCKEQLTQKDPRWNDGFEAKSSDIDVLIEQSLQQLKVPSEHYQKYLSDIAWQLKGWIGYAKWQAQYPKNPYINNKLNAKEILALWLLMECFYMQNEKACHSFEPKFKIKPDTKDDTLWAWQNAFELAQKEALLEKLSQKPSAAKDAISQWVFCIDTRSEGFRRHLESVGLHETLGFAGFFGFIFGLINKQQATHQCPALMEPETVFEIEKFTSSLITFNKTFAKNVHQTKKSVLSAFSLYELIGSWMWIGLVLKNYLPTVFRKNSTAIPTVKVPESFINSEEAVSSAHLLLAGMGLTSNFKDLVVICGHRAETDNNPFHASLECGACGGNSGVSNALVAAEVLNQPLIREKLKEKGINIPDSTTFIAACHNTTVDEIEWLVDESALSAQQQALLNTMKQDASKASKLTRKERLEDLPGDKNVKRRATHWAEIAPEWGLIRNMAMIIAPRERTQGIDLERRTFLHSYDKHADPNGDILEAIMLGPIVVGHWINSQYYFSSTDPKQFGAGNKVIHNVIPQVGVMEGNLSDLKCGLPQQSLFYRGKLIHEPVRLIVLIDADQAIINKVIAKHEHLTNLVKNRWITIESLKPSAHA